MGKKPVVSIIVLNYNEKRFLGDCLGSIARLGKGIPFECILVDNGSKDGSAEYVKRNFKWVRVLKSSENLGYAGGNNLGAKAARGEYLAILNNDTEVHRDWLSGLLKAFSCGGVGMANSKVLLHGNRSIVNAFGTETHITGITYCRGIYEKDRWDKVEEVTGAMGSSVMIRKDVFEGFGGFDEDYFIYMEDTDLCWRLRLAGYRIVAVPGSVIYHKYMLKMTPDYFRNNDRNRLVTVMKNYSWKALLLLSPSLALMEALTHVYSVFLGPVFFLKKVEGDVWIVRNLGSILAKRRKVQRLRKVRDKEIIRGFLYELPLYRTPGFVKYFVGPINLFFRANRAIAMALL